MSEPGSKDRSIFETIEVAGDRLVDKVKHILKEGNVRRLKLKAEDSDFSLELPVTVGVIVGGALVLAAPVLAVLGVIAAMAAKVKIEVERDPEITAPEAPVEPPEPAKTDAG